MAETVSHLSSLPQSFMRLDGSDLKHLYFYVLFPTPPFLSLIPSFCIIQHDEDFLFENLKPWSIFNDIVLKIHCWAVKMDKTFFICLSMRQWPSIPENIWVFYIALSFIAPVHDVSISFALVLTCHLSSPAYHRIRAVNSTPSHFPRLQNQNLLQGGGSLWCQEAETTFEPTLFFYYYY